MKPFAMRALRCALIGIALVVVSCDDEPNAPSTPSLFGTYVLESVDGAPPPDSVLIFMFLPVEFLAETLTVAPDSTYLVMASVRDLSDTIGIGYGGPIELRADSLFLVGGILPANSAAGTRTANGLDLRAMQPSVFNGRRTTYRRVSAAYPD